MQRTTHGRRAALTATAMLLLVSVAWAQFDPPAPVPGGGQFGLAGESDPAVTVRGEFTRAAAGKPGMLFVTATPKSGWHIYSISQAPGGPVRTEIRLKPSADYRVLEKFRTIETPDKKNDPAFDNLVVESHHEKVTWYAPLELSPGIDPQQLKIDGAVFAQPCQATNCLMPQEFPFAAVVGQGVALPDGGGVAPTAVAAIDWGGLVWQLFFAFVGGMILNLMPCVLPVISLKVLSFLEQSGESRARVFTLNLWYSAGVIVVFLILAALAATAGFAWGEQFTLPWFKVAMTALVFAMALSFLGVWEIPIPGFVGTGRAGELQTKEGASGAFFKGVFATILATPCSGPFLGPVFGYLLTQPPAVAYLIFGAVGLGMAFPYLVIGAFPELIRFLPRPGAWMETVKQLMAFLLLGTVVYLFTTLNAAYFIPTLTLLMGIWFAAWLIGRTPITLAPAARAAAWAGAIAVATLIGVFAFGLLLSETKIAWQPYSADALTKARQEGKTVMVEFTAAWCPTCNWNRKFAIETDKVQRLIAENRVLPLLADWTDKSPTIKKTLNDLGSQSIPLLAIWPAGNGDVKPTILPDLITEGQLVTALTKAGPSQSSAAGGGNGGGPPPP